MINFVEYLQLPAKIAVAVIAVVFAMNVVGEVLEFKGKIVPEFMKIRKYFSRKKSEKSETVKTLKEVKQLLGDVNAHYSVDNISKRDAWMQWVNNRADVYDTSINEIKQQLSVVTDALKDSTKITEELFIQNSRDRIIDFATKVTDDKNLVSREEFNRIFKVYDRYEDFLEERNMTNGEVDVAILVIRESYAQHMREHTFLEDVRGYSNK